MEPNLFLDVYDILYKVLLKSLIFGVYCLDIEGFALVILCILMLKVKKVKKVKNFKFFKESTCN